MIASKPGITKEGKPTEKMVMAILEGSSSPKKSSDGDIEWAHDGETILLEIKKNTPNQTRPWKYNILVLYQEAQDDFLVVPPNVIIRACAHKKGQHTPFPFLCWKPSITKDWAMKYGKIKTSNLKQKIIEAYREGQEDTAARQLARMANPSNEETYGKLYELQKQINLEHNTTSKKE